MKEDNYILCGEYDLSGDRCDGSVMTHCCKCDDPLWISPSGMDLVREYDAKPICFRCLKEVDKGNKEVGGTTDFVPFNQDQLKEILTFMPKDKLDELHETLRKEFNK